MSHSQRLAPVLLLLPLLVGCGGEAPPRGPAAAAAITNRIPLPAEVVANLGITFAKARRGRLETRLRVPGRVEVASDARFTVRSPAAGRVSFRTTRWQRVVRGDVVAEVLSAELRQAQSALSEILSEIERADVEIHRSRAESGPLAAIAEATDVALSSARAREKSAETALRSAEELEKAAAERVASLQGLSGDTGLSAGAAFGVRREQVAAQTETYEASRRRDEARTAVPELALKLALARSRAAMAERQISILERRRIAAQTSLRQQMRGLSVLTGVPTKELEVESDGIPGWSRLESIALRSPTDGLVVELLASEAEWVESAGPIVRVVDPTRVVFRGEVPEADAARIPADASVRVEVGCTACTALESKLGVARPLADPRTRTLLLEAPLPGDGSAYPDGASATMSVLLERSPNEETLLPAATIVQDELQTIVFRRDPAKPDQVIRTPISIGRRSEGWVEVLSEVGEGDEVVRDGVHQLRLTGIGKAPANGHFHADGTWHEGKD